MDMKTDQLMMIGGICIMVYVFGYTSLAIGIFILLILSSLFSKGKAVKKGVSAAGVTVEGAEMLEPIIINTTRKAPFRISPKMNMKVNAHWGATTMYEKIGKKALGLPARWAYRGVTKRGYGE